MASTSPEDVEAAALTLSDDERVALAERLLPTSISTPRWNPGWREAWGLEIERRRQRLENGEDRELTLEEFLSDDIG